MHAVARPTSRSSRPSSTVPGTPTRSRLSLGPGGLASTPQQSAKLQELHSMFGFAGQNGDAAQKE